MKSFNKILLLGLACLAGCTKADFVKENIDPSVIEMSDVDAKNQMLNGTRDSHNWDFEWFYDHYRIMMPWMQMATATNGNALNFTNGAGNFNTRYGRFFSNAAPRLYDVIRIIESLPEEQQNLRTNQKAMATIALAYQYFYVSDINGSLPYKDEMRGRYEGTFTPRFTTQSDLFAMIDADYKASIQMLKASTAAQVSFGDYDQYFYGNAEGWIRAANAARLRLATRLLKRDEARAKAIIQEVLSSPASDLMSENSHSWTFRAPYTFTNGGNWNPDGIRASKAMVDYMLKNKDPRLRIFFSKNSYSQQNFDTAKKQSALPLTAIYVDQRYVGSLANPDAAQQQINVDRYYTPRRIKKGNANIALDTLSNINARLFRPGQSNGTGIVYFPVITYADFCLMRAELGARGLTSDDPQEWYVKGVTASIEYYGKMATDSKILDYYLENDAGVQVAAPTAGEIADYLNASDVKYNAAKGLEQIVIQQYLNFFKQSNEAWSLWKRTGMPNETTLLQWEPLLSNGANGVIPRRAARIEPGIGSRNYDNEMEAINQMLQDPEYGAGPGDIFGRVWWDKQ